MHRDNLHDHSFIELLAVDFSKRTSLENFILPAEVKRGFRGPGSKSSLEREPAPDGVVEYFKEHSKDRFFAYAGFIWHNHGDQQFSRYEGNQRDLALKAIDPYLDKLNTKEGDIIPVSEFFPHLPRHQDKSRAFFRIPGTRYNLLIDPRVVSPDKKVDRRTGVTITDGPGYGNVGGSWGETKAFLADITYRIPSLNMLDHIHPEAKALLGEDACHHLRQGTLTQDLCDQVSQAYTTAARSAEHGVLHHDGISGPVSANRASFQSPSSFAMHLNVMAVSPSDGG